MQTVAAGVSVVVNTQIHRLLHMFLLFLLVSSVDQKVLYDGFVLLGNRVYVCAVFSVLSVLQHVGVCVVLTCY